MSKKLVNNPTPQQALEFAEFVRFWQEILNLCDWRIEPGVKPAKGAMADVEVNSPARLAVYRLGDFAGTQINPISLSQTALHEVLHVFLHDLIAAAQDRGTTEEQLEAAEHRVINVLEKILFVEPEQEDAGESNGPAVH